MADPSGFQETLQAAIGAANADAFGATEDNNGNSMAVLTIEDANASGYCTPTRSQNAVLTIKLVSNQQGLLPPVKADSAGSHGVAKLTIMCPSASANLGTDLVPDNPFPPTSE